LLITSVPAGYLQQPDSVGDTGPSDLAKAVSDDGGGSDAKAALVKDGFVGGYQRLWQTADENRIIVFIYQFADAAGATEYHNRTVAEQRSDPSGKPAEFAVPQIPTAVGLEPYGADGGLASVSFRKDVYVVQVVLGGPSVLDVETLVQQLADAQYKRL
jgi:hypothetical protein